MNPGERSNISSSHQTNRLPKSRILRGKRNFQRLFDDSTLLRGRILNLRVRLYDNPDEGVRVGFIVRKALGKAVRRNRARRRIREAWRLNQHLLLNHPATPRTGIHMVWMARTLEFSTAQAEEEIRLLSERLSRKLRTADAS